VVRSDAGAPVVAPWSTVRAGTGAVARPRTGWPSPARRVLGGGRPVVFPPRGGDPIRLRVDDRASDLAYRESMPADQPRRATAGLTVE